MGYGARVIVLQLADERQLELSDEDARLLAGRLWDMAAQQRTAVVAIAIQDALRHHERMRQTIEVPATAIERVTNALGQLH